MFRSIITKIRGWLAKLGLVKSIQKLTDQAELQVSEKMYQMIDMWKQLYQGYYSDWHDVQYHTVNGTKRRRRASLGMAKVIAAEMATLVFNERCEINVSDKTLGENIQDIFNKNKFVMKFQDNLEYQFALGGMIIKPYVEDDQIKLSFVKADCFLPLSWDNNGISEGVFVNEIQKGDKRYIHLEWHTWENTKEGKVYLIRNELYESQNGDDIGIPVDLGILFPELEQEVRIKGLTRPIFVYFKPNIANNIDMDSPLGISLFANALDTMKSLDIAFDSFQREFVLGRKRIIVPATAVKTVIDPESGKPHRYFDVNDEVYEAFNFEMDSKEIKDISVELRIEEHIAAINAMLNLLAMQTGFSAGSFSFDGKSVKTATEVVSENSKTFRSKKAHENIIEAGLTELIESIVQLAELYGLFSRPAKDWDVTATFDDSIVEDENGEIDKQIKMVINRLTSRKRAIMKVHGLTEKEAEQLLAEIEVEEKRTDQDLEETLRESVLFGARE